MYYQLCKYFLSLDALLKRPPPVSNGTTSVKRKYAIVEDLSYDISRQCIGTDEITSCKRFGKNYQLQEISTSYSRSNRKLSSNFFSFSQPSITFFLILFEVERPDNENKPLTFQKFIEIQSYSSSKFEQ